MCEDYPCCGHEVGDCMDTCPHCAGDVREAPEPGFWVHDITGSAWCGPCDACNAEADEPCRPWCIGGAS